MSKRAKQAALKAYPEKWFRDIDGDSYDCNRCERCAFQEGYEQAEKDLALIPDDIGLINKLLFDMHFEGFDVNSTEKAHERNVEVLRRFLEQRKK